jgi:hypothetical protein
MAVLILFILFLLVPVIIKNNFLTKEKLLMMSPIWSIITPYITIYIVIYILVQLFTIISALRTCSTDQSKHRSYGLVSGMKLGLMSGMTACLAYLCSNLYPILTLPFLAFSALPYSTEIGKSLYLAFGGLIGYYFGQLFVNIC